MEPDSAEARQRCAFVVKKKNRQCRMLALKDRKYCGEHVLEDSASSQLNSEDQLRIKCPLDGTHTCFAKNLKRHLRVCNARVTQLPPYHVHDINAGEGAPPSPGRTIHQLTDPQLLTLLNSVQRLHDAHVLPVEVVGVSHPVLEASLVDPQLGPDTLRHLRQNSAILGLMRDCRVLDGARTYVELGSGKAHLSSWLARAVSSEAQIVLVDRASHRHKAENKLKDRSDVCAIQRLKIDIQHLRLAGCDACVGRPVVAISKHLCGAATDLGLRAAVGGPSSSSTETSQPSVAPVMSLPGSAAEAAADTGAEPATNGAATEASTEPQVDVQAILIALCCHHRLEWSSYVGKQFLQECGFSASDLTALRGVAAWATCSTPSWSSPPPKRRRTLVGSDTAAEAAAAGTAAADLTEGSTSVALVKEGSTAAESRPTVDAAETAAAGVEPDPRQPAGNGVISGDVTSTGGDKRPASSAVYSDLANGDRLGQDMVTRESGDTGSEAVAASETSTGTEPTANEASSFGRYQRLGLSPERRTQLGFLCKRLLDEGRRRFLETRGFSSRLVQFVPPDVSPENVLLLATRSTVALPR